MRWNDLFGDLEGQFSAAQATEFEAGVRDLAEAERATVRLAGRLLASVGESVSLTLRGGTRVTGTVSDVAAAWVLLADGARETLVPLGAVAVATGVEHKASRLGSVAERLGLGHALRALAGEGVAVLVTTSGGDVLGRITGVGEDHMDVVMDDGSAVAVAFAEIRLVASAP